MRTLVTTLSIIILLGFSISANAQATRTWVSGVGDDVNPCSRTAPCKTWAGAISKTAAAGEINAIDSGGFGGVTIVKSMTLDGAGVHASILASGANGIVINAGATDKIYIRNLSINGGNTGLSGIRILQAGSVTIENVTIFNFNGSTSSRAIAIVNSSNNIKVTVKNTTIRNVAGVMLESIPSGTGSVSLVLDNVLMTECAQSAIDLDNNTQAVIARSTIVNNTLAGLFVETATCTASVFESVISRNGTGILVGSGGGGLVRLYGTQVTGNTTSGITITPPGAVESHGNNVLVGNAGTQAASALINTQ